MALLCIVTYAVMYVIRNYIVTHCHVCVAHGDLCIYSTNVPGHVCICRAWSLMYM